MENPSSSIHHVVQRVIDFKVMAILIATYLSFYLASTAYRIFIYPHYVSPLRHLPGPKVSSLLKTWRTCQPLY